MAAGRLDHELRKLGKHYILEDCMIANGYADAVERFYGNRLLLTEDHVSPVNGPQRFFMIRL